MAGMVEKKLTELGLALPALAAPLANYVGSVRTGNLLFVSGQLCLGADGKLDNGAFLRRALLCPAEITHQVSGPPLQGLGRAGPLVQDVEAVLAHCRQRAMMPVSLGRRNQAPCRRRVTFREKTFTQ